jgi:O-antigen ligase
MNRTVAVPMQWFEWPLLAYIMLHYFPPVRGPWGTVCLVLGTIGVLWECRRRGCRPLADFNQPVVWCLGLLGALFAASLIQVPPELLAESWKRFSSNFLKGCGFGLILFLYLKDETRARRVLMAGMLACAMMIIHLIWDTVRDIQASGQLPFQRDYLFYSTFFFPFALVVYFSGSRWRWLAFFAATGILAAAVLTGFRGAMLTLLVMALIIAIFGRLWNVLAFGALLAVAGVVALHRLNPTYADYILGKLRQTDGSNRFSGHWLPAWDMSWQSPWLGHGYSHLVFRHHYDLQVDLHPNWTPMWSETLGRLPSDPHNITMEIFFAAGLPAVLLYFALALLVVRALAPAVWRGRGSLQRDPWLLLALAVLTAFVGNYLVFYQFDAPSWRTLPVAIAIVAACRHALAEREKGG